MDEGLRKSAILLLSLGEDGASSVLRQLPHNAVESISGAMASLKKVGREEAMAVMEEFRTETEQYPELHLSESYLRATLTKALGDDHAADVLERIFQTNAANSGIERLNQLEPAEVVEIIRDEHPQIIATLLVHMDRNAAAKVLENLPDRIRNDAVLRIASFGGVQPAALKELTDVLNNVLAGQAIKGKQLGGVTVAAEMVNRLTGSMEEGVIQHMREQDEVLAQKLVDEMFVFENLITLDDRGLQALMKEVESTTLVVALKGASEELRAKFFKNMSQRAAEALREEMEERGPVRLSQVEAEQKNVLLIVRRLADSGELVLGGKGDDSYV